MLSYLVFSLHGAIIVQLTRQQIICIVKSDNKSKSLQQGRNRLDRAPISWKKSPNKIYNFLNIWWAKFFQEYRVLYAHYTLKTLYTLYAIYTLYAHYTLYTLYTLYTIYTLYALYIYTILYKHSIHSINCTLFVYIPLFSIISNSSMPGSLKEVINYGGAGHYDKLSR